jgi:siroheme synthase-like protein
MSGGFSFPLFLDLRGVPVLVVGGGAVATRKVRGLLASGARVRLAALRVAPALRALAKRRPELRLARRAFRTSDLKGVRLVFAATDDRALNEAIAARAWESGLWVCSAAPQTAGRASVPAVLRRGPLQLAISTAGAAPSLARALRRSLAASPPFLDRAWRELAELAASRRKRILESARDERRRRRLLRELSRPAWLAFLRRFGRRRTARKMDALLARALAGRRT